MSDPDLVGPIEAVLSGFGFTEGPCWHHGESAFHFSDITGNARYRLRHTQASVTAHPANHPNGSAVTPDGDSLVCEHDTHSVVRVTSDGRRHTIASHYDSKELNSPNDVCVGADGRIWFTDPPFGRRPPFGLDRPRDLSIQGIYVVDPSDGVVTLVSDDFALPNGICLSPGGDRLYVNDTARAHIRVFDLARPDPIELGLFAAGIGAGFPTHQCPDGMKCDAEGNVWVTAPGSIWVYAPNGSRLGVAAVPGDQVANFCWGGADHRDLLLCVGARLLLARAAVAGHQLPWAQ